MRYEKGRFTASSHPHTSSYHFYIKPKSRFRNYLVTFFPRLRRHKFSHQICSRSFEQFLNETVINILTICDCSYQEVNIVFVCRHTQGYRIVTPKRFRCCIVTEIYSKIRLFHFAFPSLFLMVLLYTILIRLSIE